MSRYPCEVVKIKEYYTYKSDINREVAFSLAYYFKSSYFNKSSTKFSL